MDETESLLDYTAARVPLLALEDVPREERASTRLQLLTTGGLRLEDCVEELRGDVVFLRAKVDPVEPLRGWWIHASDITAVARL